jgi:hypothetical protein
MAVVPMVNPVARANNSGGDGAWYSHRMGLLVVDLVALGFHPIVQICWAFVSSLALPRMESGFRMATFVAEYVRSEK